MANQQHLLILKQGKAAWNEWRKQNQNIIPDLSEADLKGVDLKGIDFSYSNLRGAHLEKANLDTAHLENSHLNDAHLEGCTLRKAHLERANLDSAHMEGVLFFRAYLTEANLRYVYLDRTCNFDSVTLDKARVADTRWGDVNIGLVAWDRVNYLGDELDAKNVSKPSLKDSKEKKDEWLRFNRRAIRANRQVAILLRNQGWDEVAEKLEYRAQVLQRKLTYRQGIWGKTGLRTGKNPSIWWSIRKIVASRFSLFLDLVSGYGYKPWRWIYLYLLTILVFAFFQYSAQKPLMDAISFNPQNLYTWFDAVSRSVLALHGRPFILSTDPHSVINIFEAFVGLVIEAILIAIITKRILGKSS